jgi:hypothetical protein
MKKYEDNFTQEDKIELAEKSFDNKEVHVVFLDNKKNKHLEVDLWEVSSTRFKGIGKLLESQGKKGATRWYNAQEFTKDQAIERFKVYIYEK